MNPTRLASAVLLIPLLTGCPTRTVYDNDGGAGGTAGGGGRDGQARSGSAGSAGSRNSGGTGAVGGLTTGGAGGTAGQGANGVGSGGFATSGSGGGGPATGGTAGKAGSGGMGGTAGNTTGGSASGGTSTGGMGGVAGNPTGGTGTGGSTCTNTASDAANCGACGHSCLGGKCTAGMCQPLLLGTVPVTDFAEETVVLNGTVYVFSENSQTGQRSNVWQVDATTPGTPTEVITPGRASCILGQALFWTTFDNPGRIFSCKLSNCTATAAPIVTLATGSSFGSLLRCDPAAQELVWTSTVDGSNFAIYRASATGTNSRVNTKLSFPNDGASWGLLNPGTQAKRIFYLRSSVTVTPSGMSGSASLYYIATDIMNAAGVSVATVQDVQIGDILASDDLVLVSESPLSNLSAWEELSVPLPNGILSGTAPVFANGSISSAGGVLDHSNFYGTISNSSVPSDAIVTCPASGCSTPAVLFRGQSSASAFVEDAAALYWTTNAFTQAEGFSIWKAAK